MAPRSYKYDSKYKALQREKEHATRAQQLEEAIKYCKKNKCRGHKAMAAGICPLIKSRKTIDDRLDHPDKECRTRRKDSSILTDEEEASLVRFIKNKNRACQGLARKAVTKVVYDMLVIRSVLNRKFGGGRRFIPLSKAAKNVLLTKKLSRSYFRKLEVKNNITKKRQGSVSSNRAASCSKAIATQHLDELAKECIDCGIFTEAVQVEPGVWTGHVDLSRIYNHDEMPQFINYGVDGRASNLVYCGKGDKCDRLCKENRECVTIEPFVSLAGEIDVCHVIFPGTCITDQMAPEEAVEKIKNLLISMTKSGYQDHNTCLESYKMLNRATANKVRPLVVLTDGHSSRFNTEVMRYCRKEQLHQFLGPPDSTSLTQLLDQIFAMLHAAYIDKRDEMFFSESINRKAFMHILAEVWNEWASVERIKNAARRVGITEGGFDVSLMNQDMMTRTELLTTSTPVKEKPSTIVQSPENCRRDTKDYWKLKYEAAMSKIRELEEIPVSPEEVVPDLLSIQKIQGRAAKKAPIRCTQQYGSMEGKGILEQVEHLEEQRIEKENKKKEKEEQKSAFLQRFYRCQNKCCCGKSKCEASGLQMCSQCSSILRSKCGKKGCVIDEKKPVMHIPVCDEKVLKVSEVYSSSDEGCIDDDDESDTSLDSLSSFDEDEGKQNKKPKKTLIKISGAQFRQKRQRLEMELSSDEEKENYTKVKEPQTTTHSDSTTTKSILFNSLFRPFELLGSCCCSYNFIKHCT